MKKTKISKNPNSNWNNDVLQFARFLAELESAGAFTPTVCETVMNLTDWNAEELDELINRAQAIWDEAKTRT